MALSSGVIMAVLLLTGTSSVSAQSTAVVCGTVTAARNSPMPGVAVSVERDGAAPLKAITDKDGDYLVGDLAPGTYRISFVLAGFKKAVRVGFLAVAGHEFRADQVMEIAVPHGGEPPVVSASVAYDLGKTSPGATFTKTTTPGGTVAPRPCKSEK